MSKQFQFKVSIVAAAISMMMAGAAMAADTIVGNTLEGPNVTTSGNATVMIDQSGTGNVTSSTGNSGGGAFVVNQSEGDTTILTIQQVGANNNLALSSFTNAATSIQVFQGADAELGNAGLLVGDSTKTVSSNWAGIGIGEGNSARAGATDVFLTQQGNTNVANLQLGTSGGVFTGVLNLLQVGNTNTANVRIDGQTTAGQTFNIGQGGSDSLTLVANGDQYTGMTLDFGGLSFGQTTSLPIPGPYTSDFDDAAQYDYATLGANAGLKNSFAGSSMGINLRGTDVFKITTMSGLNKVQVDLQDATAISNKIDVMLGGGSNFAVYGVDGSAISLGGNRALRVANGKELVVYAKNAFLNVNGVFFDANSYFSSANGGAITMSRGTVGSVGSVGLSVLQSGSVHSFSSMNSDMSYATWNAVQTGPVANMMIANNNLGSSSNLASFNLTQTSVVDGDAHMMELNNSGDKAKWTVAQTGSGAKTLDLTNSTPSALINATQSGDATQSATGISFAALSGSFTLVQR